MMIKISYSGYRFPPEIIQQAIWLYVRFTLSFRDVEDLLAERGIVVSYETVRRWVNHFGPIAADLRKRRPKPQSLGRKGLGSGGPLGVFADGRVNIHNQDRLACVSRLGKGIQIGEVQTGISIGEPRVRKREVVRHRIPLPVD
jgi:hypothetical protein